MEEEIPEDWAADELPATVVEIVTRIDDVGGAVLLGQAGQTVGSGQISP